MRASSCPLWQTGHAIGWWELGFPPSTFTRAGYSTLFWLQRALHSHVVLCLCLCSVWTLGSPLNSAFHSFPLRKTNRQGGREAEKREKEAEKTKERERSRNRERQTDSQIDRQTDGQITLRGRGEEKHRPYSSVYLHFPLLNHELAVLLCAPTLTRR